MTPPKATETPSQERLIGAEHREAQGGPSLEVLTPHSDSLGAAPWPPEVAGSGRRAGEPRAENRGPLILREPQDERGWWSPDRTTSLVVGALLV